MSSHKEFVVALRWMGVTALVVLLSVGTASAGMLADGTDAIDGFYGSSVGTGYSPGVTLEFAVYAPGDYPLDDPSGGAHYVYAYQLNNTSAYYDSVIKLTVGLEGDESVANIGWSDDPTRSGELSPSAWDFSTNQKSAYWDFSPALNFGSWSAILRFTSPASPEWDDAEMLGYAGTGDFGAVPNPGTHLPEPASWVLLALGAALLPVFARKRRLR